MPTPLDRYQRDLARPDFIADAAQKNAVQHTHRLFEALVAAHNQKNYSGVWGTFSDRLRRKTPQPTKGLYFWGGVGRGKTYLVDNFFDTLPFAEKRRLHFHRFMQFVHHELKKAQNIQNPLVKVAREFAQNVRVLCLDEFHVADITDAMLLGNLLKALFDNRVTLVATSNIPPDELYKNGLQRDRFLPAIALLKQHTEVVNVDNGTDYRLRSLEHVEIYHYPLNAQADEILLSAFDKITSQEAEIETNLELNDRLLKVRRMAESVIWFDFLALCDIPRAVQDYIELARCFNTVFLSNVPQMTEMQNDLTVRFINLVDEFYDRNVKLIMSAEVPAEQLYTGKRHAFPFQRTLSRLKEMQSREYLERPHLP